MVLGIETAPRQVSGMPGPKDALPIDWMKSDLEIFHEHVKYFADDMFEDASKPNCLSAAVVCCSVILLLVLCKADLGSVLVYLLGCRTLQPPGQWDAGLL